MLGFSNMKKINFDNDDRILKDVKKIDNSNKNITLSGHGSHAVTQVTEVTLVIDLIMLLQKFKNREES